MGCSYSVSCLISGLVAPVQTAAFIAFIVGPPAKVEIWPIVRTMLVRIREH